MKRNIDVLGRITLPKGFRDELDIKEGSEVSLEINDNQLIITAPRLMKTKEEVENQLKIVQKLIKEDEASAFYKGYEIALNWVLNASNSELGE